LTELDGKTFESDWSVAVSATTQETPKPEPAPAAATPAPAEPTPAPAAPTAGDTNTIGGGSGPTVFECKCGAQFATEEEVQAHAHHYVDLWLHGKVTKEETEKHSNYRFW
jgi:pyruvate/2-oxoglutarate dehydrogenase complex dihydrolipoamide acyltransferase (E2) component